MLTMSDLGYDFSHASAEHSVMPVRTAAELDHLLDEALGDTFPASDPVAELRISSPAVKTSATSQPVRPYAETLSTVNS
jgi:hypothetical protein